MEGERRGSRVPACGAEDRTGDISGPSLESAGDGRGEETERPDHVEGPLAIEWPADSAGLTSDVAALERRVDDELVRDVPRDSAPFEVLGRRADSTLLASLRELMLLRPQSMLVRCDDSTGVSLARARFELLALWPILTGRLASLAGAMSETTELSPVRASDVNEGRAGRGR